jgi:hypothetical protein
MVSTSSEAEKGTHTPELENGEPIAHKAATSTPAPAADTTLAILQLVTAQNAHHPMHWAGWKRWTIIIVYCLLQMFVTLTSTSYIGIESLIQEAWGGSTQVVTLGQSMFIVGTAIGPAFMGPLRFAFPGARTRLIGILADFLFQ